MNYNPICHICGKFMSWVDCDEAVVYVPYQTSPIEFDMPDDEYIHIGCWETSNEDSKRLIQRISWIKPVCLNGKKLFDEHGEIL